MPETTDPQPTLVVELSPATRFDPVQHFTVDAMRVMFTGGRGRMAMGPGAAAPALPLYKYKLEVSQDGETYTTVVDKTNNTVNKDTIFEEFTPVNCRFVRFTVTDWPKNGPMGIIDFTVFGYPDGWDQPAVATPTFSNLPLDAPQPRR